MNAAAKKPLKTLLVDDEAPARRGLKLRLKSVPDIDIAGEARNGKEAVQKIRDLGPDLVFLDIQMPSMSGFDVLAELRDDALPAIIFVTAYDEFAIRAFEVNAVDYLLKPIEADRLQEALERARQRLGKRRLQSHKKILLKLLSDITGEEVHSLTDVQRKGAHGMRRKEAAKLAIRDGGKTTWVKQDDIEWIDAAGDYMCVHALGETHIMRKTMKELERELDPELLQRIHRSTIVNIRCVKEMQSHINGEYFLTLDSGHTVKLSRTYKSKLRLLQ